MEITIEDLMKGKATVIKNKNYFSTEAYVEPFLERMSKFTSDFRAQVKLPDQMSITKDGSMDLTDTVFNRVNIEAILPEEYAFEGHKKVVGFVYALDTRKPIVKEYVGGLRSACLNLCVFNPEALSVQELEPETAINYNFCNTCMSMVDNIESTLKRLSSIEITKIECYEKLGRWIDNCFDNKKNSFISTAGKVKLATSLPVDAYKNLFYNEKSEYYSENGIVTGFDVYNSFTDLICNGSKPDIVNRFEKTYLISQILDI